MRPWRGPDCSNAKTKAAVEGMVPTPREPGGSPWVAEQAQEGQDLALTLLFILIAFFIDGAPKSCHPVLTTVVHWDSAFQVVCFSGSAAQAFRRKELTDTVVNDFAKS